MLELNFGKPRPPTRGCMMRIVLWSAFFNGLIASLISLPTILQSQPATFGLLPQVYLLLQQLGHFQFFAFLFSLPILIITLLLPNKRLIQALTVLMFSGFILLVVIDYAVYDLYRFHLNGMVWNMLTGGALQEIFVFDRSNIFTLGAFILGIMLAQMALQLVLGRKPRRDKKRWGWRMVFIVLLIQLTGISLYAWADARHKTTILSMTRFIPLAQSSTIMNFLREHGWVSYIGNNSPEQPLSATSG